MSRRFTEWSLDGTVEVITHGPRDIYEVHTVEHDGFPIPATGPLVGYVTKDVSQPRSREWRVYDSRRLLIDQRPTLASALGCLANHAAERRETRDRRLLDVEAEERYVTGPRGSILL